MVRFFACRVSDRQNENVFPVSSLQKLSRIDGGASPRITNMRTNLSAVYDRVFGCTIPTPPNPAPSIEYQAIHPSPAELKNGQLSPANVQQALTEFHRNRFLVLENATSHRSLNHVRERMLASDRLAFCT